MTVPMTAVRVAADPAQTERRERAPVSVPRIQAAAFPARAKRRAWVQVLGNATGSQRRAWVHVLRNPAQLLRWASIRVLSNPAQAKRWALAQRLSKVAQAQYRVHVPRVVGNAVHPQLRARLVLT